MTGSTLGGLASWHMWSNSGSWPRFVKRGGLEVLPYFPAHGREGEAAPLLRRNRLILLVQVAILMASRTLAKNQPSWQSTKIYRNKNFDASITQDDEILFVGIRLPAFASIRGLWIVSWHEQHFLDVPVPRF